MRKIREVLRQFHEINLSERKISESCKLSRRSVGRYIEKAKTAGLVWPLPKDLDDMALERLLYPSAEKQQTGLPDWHEVHRELKKKGVTLFLLWEEYRQQNPNGLSYSRYCQLHREFKKSLEPVMRQTHTAGEKMFVDYAGLTVPWVDKFTGEIHKAQIFVAVLGASNYTFIEATASQCLQDWIGSHVRAFQFYGGVVEVVVPDNLRSGVTKPHYYDPDINPTYQDMANHYGVAVIPTRVRKPKDKAKVEVGVQGIERRILAQLRHHTFFSLAEINEAIKPLLAEYNARLFQKLPGSRLSQFNELEKPVLKPLPVHPYEYAQWKKVRAGIDYHIAFEYHYYSVPYRYKGYELDCRITQSMLTCFYKGKTIAIHRRSFKKGHTTVKEHMPKHHQAYAEWTPARLIQWAEKSGRYTAQLIEAMLMSRPHPQQAFRACLGVMRLGKSYGDDRLEKAAQRALAIGAFSYKSMESILKNGLDQQPLIINTEEEKNKKIKHENIRGAYYYH